MTADALTAAQRARAKKVWGAADATLATVLIWLALRYGPPQCEHFILLKWEDLGPPLQDDITRAINHLCERLL